MKTRFVVILSFLTAATFLQAASCFGGSLAEAADLSPPAAEKRTWSGFFMDIGTAYARPKRLLSAECRLVENHSTIPLEKFIAQNYVERLGVAAAPLATDGADEGRAKLVITNENLRGLSPDDLKDLATMELTAHRVALNQKGGTKFLHNALALLDLIVERQDGSAARPDIAFWRRSALAEEILSRRGAASAGSDFAHAMELLWKEGVLEARVREERGEYSYKPSAAEMAEIFYLLCRTALVEERFEGQSALAPLLAEVRKMLPGDYKNMNELDEILSRLTGNLADDYNLDFAVAKYMAEDTVRVVGNCDSDECQKETIKEGLSWTEEAGHRAGKSARARLAALENRLYVLQTIFPSDDTPIPGGWRFAADYEAEAQRALNEACDFFRTDLKFPRYGDPEDVWENLGYTSDTKKYALEDARVTAGRIGSLTYGYALKSAEFFVLRDGSSSHYSLPAAHANKLDKLLSDKIAWFEQMIAASPEAFGSEGVWRLFELSRLRARIAESAYLANKTPWFFDLAAAARYHTLQIYPLDPAGIITLLDLYDYQINEAKSETDKRELTEHLQERLGWLHERIRNLSSWVAWSKKNRLSEDEVKARGAAVEAESLPDKSRKYSLSNVDPKKLDEVASTAVNLLLQGPLVLRVAKSVSVILDDDNLRKPVNMPSGGADLSAVEKESGRIVAAYRPLGKFSNPESRTVPEDAYLTQCALKLAGTPDFYGRTGEEAEKRLRTLTVGMTAKDLGKIDSYPKEYMEMISELRKDPQLDRCIDSAIFDTAGAVMQGFVQDDALRELLGDVYSSISKI